MRYCGPCTRIPAVRCAVRGAQGEDESWEAEASQLEQPFWQLLLLLAIGDPRVGGLRGAGGNCRGGGAPTALARRWFETCSTVLGVQPSQLESIALHSPQSRRPRAPPPAWPEPRRQRSEVPHRRLMGAPVQERPARRWHTTGASSDPVMRRQGAVMCRERCMKMLSSRAGYEYISGTRSRVPVHISSEYGDRWQCAVDVVS